MVALVGLSGQMEARAIYWIAHEVLVQVAV